MQTLCARKENKRKFPNLLSLSFLEAPMEHGALSDSGYFANAPLLSRMVELE